MSYLLRRSVLALVVAAMVLASTPAPSGAWVTQSAGFNQRFTCLVHQFWWWNAEKQRYNTFLEGYAAADSFYSAIDTVKPQKRAPAHTTPKMFYGIGTPAGAPAKRYVLIDKSQHHLWVYVDGRIVRDMPMVDSDRITPVGTFYSNRCVPRNGGILPNFIGLDATANGTWYSNLNRMVYSGIGIHGIPYRSSTAVAGNQTYSTSLLGQGTRQSAGCINVSRENASFLFHFMLPGTPAVITAGNRALQGKPGERTTETGNEPIESPEVQRSDPPGQ